MLKFYINKFVPKKLGNKLAMIYENWFILPQNESLIEIKRKEFRERTKYLDPKILYTLTEEEKADLRSQGYYVDINEKTVKEIKDFKLTYNRHLNKYNLMDAHKNFAIYNTKYYYTDQNYFNFMGDDQYYNKMWRNRSRIKYKISMLILGYCLLWVFYKLRLKEHSKKRKIVKKMAENNPSLIMKIENVP